VYDVNPDDLDDEKNPTAAWTVGEHLDEETIAKLLAYLGRGEVQV
jgi:hypothetical protein